MLLLQHIQHKLGGGALRCRTLRAPTKNTHEHHTHEYHTHANALLSSYGRGRERGAARPEVLQSLLSTTDRIVQEVDSVEYGLTDIQVCLRDAFGVACASLVYSVEFGLACAGLVYSVEFGMCWFGV